MFRSLIESIRLEASARGSLNAAYQRSPGMSKVVKKGATRFIRQAGKAEIRKVQQDPSADEVTPRRGIKGYSD